MDFDFDLGLDDTDWPALKARIDAAKKRDDIFTTLLDFCSQKYSFACIFVVHGMQAHGWRGTSAKLSERLRKIVVPFETPTVLQTIYATRGHYLGPLPNNKPNTQLLRDLERPTPHAALLAPLIVADRLAAIIYADCGTLEISDTVASTLLLGTQHVGLRLTQLLHDKKKATEQREAYEGLQQALEALESPLAETANAALHHLLHLGTEADFALTAYFPGPLHPELLSGTKALPPFEQVSGLAKLLKTRGPSAAPVVLPALESPMPMQRLMAVYFCASVQVAGCAEKLIARLYDSYAPIRYLAADALRRYRDEASYQTLIESLFEQLRLPALAQQVTAIQIMGQLRETRAVPTLLRHVSDAQPILAHAAQSALAVICSQNFGSDALKWRSWWQINSGRSRTEWLLLGLSHSSSHVRRLANTELQLASGLAVPYAPDASDRERRQGIQRWEQWLSQTKTAV